MRPQKTSNITSNRLRPSHIWLLFLKIPQANSCCTVEPPATAGGLGCDKGVRSTKVTKGWKTLGSKRVEQKGNFHPCTLLSQSQCKGCTYAQDFEFFGIYLSTLRWQLQVETQRPPTQITKQTPYNVHTQGRSSQKPGKSRKNRPENQTKTWKTRF